MHKRSFVRIALVSLLCFPALASAESINMADMIFVPALTVASGFEKETVFNSVSTISVITQDMIAKYNFQTVGEALENLAGFNIWRTYLKKRIPISRGILQEHYANKVLVMINNVPMWNAVTGEGSLDRVNLHLVERIEVLKGPASVLYGSNAYTGAVNIVLKEAPENRKIGLVFGGVGSGREDFGGTLGSPEAGGMYAMNSGDFSCLLGAGSYREDWPAYQMRDEAGNRAQVSEFLQNQDLTLHGNYQNHSWLYNSSFGQENYLGTTPLITGGLGQEQYLESHAVNYAYLLDLAPFKAKASATFDWGRRNTVRTADGNTRSDIVGSRLVGHLEGNYELGDLDVQLGGDYENRHSTAYSNYQVLQNVVVSENGLRDQGVTEWSVFGQAGYQFAPFKVLLGSRLTQNELFGSNVSSRGSLIFEINKTNSVKLIAGQSYRSPSLFELYFATSPVTVFGNKDLKPETSNSVELAYLTSFENFFIQALGYYANYEGNIFRTNGTFVYNGVTYNNVNFYTNAPRFAATGAELEVKYALPSTEVFVNADYVVGTDEDRVQIGTTGQYSYNFKYVPKLNLSGGVWQAFGPFFASATANYYGTMGAPVEEIPASYWLDASVGYKQEAMTHVFSVKNATHQDILIPEYVRRTMNSVPLMRGIRLDYSFTVAF